MHPKLPSNRVCRLSWHMQGQKLPLFSYPSCIQQLGENAKCHTWLILLVIHFSVQVILDHLRIFNFWTSPVQIHQFTNVVSDFIGPKTQKKNSAPIRGHWQDDEFVHLTLLGIRFFHTTCMAYGFIILKGWTNGYFLVLESQLHSLSNLAKQTNKQTKTGTSNSNLLWLWCIYTCQVSLLLRRKDPTGEPGIKCHESMTRTEHFCESHLNHEKKTAGYFPWNNWLFNDGILKFHGLWNFIPIYCNWAVIHHLPLNNRFGPFFHCSF